MANFNTLNEITTSTDADFYHLQQGGVDYKHNRETLAAAISNARWSSAFAYIVGSEVVGSDGNKYVAVGNSTGEDPTTDDGTYWRVISRNEIAPNKVKTSQFVVKGTTGNPVPSGVATTYAVSAEMALGWVVTTEVVDAVLDSNGNLTATSGIVRYTIDKADNGTPSVSKIYASVMRCTDSATSTYVHDYASATNGILVSESATKIYLDIDFSSFAGGVVFGVSEQIGRLPINSSQEVSSLIYSRANKQRLDVTSSRSLNTVYTNTTGAPFDVVVQVSNAVVSSSFNNQLEVNGDVACKFNDIAPSSVGFEQFTLKATVNNGDTYELSALQSTLLKWEEIR